MTDADYKAFVLRALLRARGTPVSTSTLCAAVRLAFPEQPSDADTTARLRELEAQGYLAATQDDLLGCIWGLTPKGQLRATQL